MSFQKLHYMWLYYVEKKNWEGLIHIYSSLAEIDAEVFFNFKKYVDCHRSIKSKDINNFYLLEVIPAKYKKKLIKLFYKNKNKIKSKMHIISDMDDTLVKTYNLPGHDYSTKMNNGDYSNITNNKFNGQGYYPYILNSLQQFIAENKKSSKFITICSMRPSYLSDYSKSTLSHYFDNYIHTIMTTPFLFLYHSFLTLLYIFTEPFTMEWFEKYKISGYIKYTKIKVFSQIYPELCISFIGDTGEGDLITAILLILNNKINIKNIFLHDIKNKNNVSYIKQNQELFLFNNEIKVVKKDKKLKVYKNLDKLLYEIYLFDNFNFHDIEYVMKKIES